MTLYGLEIYSSDIDDRGIDFIVRKYPNSYWDIQVKSSRTTNYIFIEKSKFYIKENFIVALALFNNNENPDIFLIPSTVWATPDGMFVDRDYEGKISKPEYGINLSKKNYHKLDQFRFENMVTQIFKSQKMIDVDL
ncbi:hypothetical protein K9U40_21960 [Xanthobacter autotrophicus]|uniref:hypothetical protein n=1 Tax=Xanthobacter TaxID=279 RepID=UPI0024ABCD5A|nr:hypothetical protein [Xanthobacter autotrophicus]MDI4666964.1 hypothetical protein [Xanthobacter autotrophicus]